MQDKPDEVTPRHFSLMSAAGLSDEARKALNAAFDAMSTWRIETAKNSEKNSEQVIEKTAAAARALGWPNEIVDGIRAQMQGIARLQIQMMDHIMDAWEEQIKSPNPMGSFPSAIFEAELTTRPWPGRKRLPRNRGGEPFSVLDTNRGTVAESLHGRHGVLDQGGRCDRKESPRITLYKRGIWRQLAVGVASVGG